MVRSWPDGITREAEADCLHYPVGAATKWRVSLFVRGAIDSAEHSLDEELLKYGLPTDIWFHVECVTAPTFRLVVTVVVWLLTLCL